MLHNVTVRMFYDSRTENYVIYQAYGETYEADDTAVDDRHKKDRVILRPMTDEEIETYENLVSKKKNSDCGE